MTMTPEMDVATKYQSHLPALLACIISSHGPVIELGVGHFSTPHLHALCGAFRRDLISCEEDPDWFVAFRSKYESEGHFFYNVRESWTLDRYGVAFIDHSPGGENRASAFRSAIRKADLVVVHDYWQDNEEAIAPLLTGITHHVCKDYEPPTLVASMVFPIPPVLLNM